MKSRAPVDRLAWIRNRENLYICQDSQVQTSARFQAKMFWTTLLFTSLWFLSLRGNHSQYI